jgi:tetratricopeptide (TPR) repeat protein
MSLSIQTENMPCHTPLAVRHRAQALLLAYFCLYLFPQNSFSQNKPSEQLTLRIIVVSSAEDAESIRRRLQQGGDFASMAAQQSLDPSADQGGLMGKVTLATLRPELREAVRGLAPGDISKVVSVPLGYAILKVVPESELGSKGHPYAPGNLGTASTGSVKYTLTVGGWNDAEQAFANFDKLEGWNQDPQQICKVRQQSLAAQKKVTEDFLSASSTGALASQPPIDIMNAHFSLAEINSYQGNMDAAVDEYKKTYQIALSAVPKTAPQMTEALGIAYLHKSEMANDVYHAPGERCLLPMHPTNAYAKTADSELAVDYFLKYLAQKPDELEVRWLLNFAYMTLGTYPEKVPKKYLIPPSAFASAGDVGRFVDVASKTGLNLFSMAGGLIVDDFENNGRLDVVTSSFDNCGPMHYFHNNGDGTFEDTTAHAGLADQLGGLNMIQTDYNNDGCIDILLLRGAWEVAQRKSLLRNNCDGTFTDVTVASGLAEPATSTQAAVWIDINNDGSLDLFVGNEDGPAQLFLNGGDGTFKDISKAAGVDRIAFTKGVAAGDYDNDGYPDLYVSNLNGRNFLYHNNHNATFNEVAIQAGVPGPGRGFATWFFDYDNDGWPDLFATSYYLSVDESVRTYLGLPHNAPTLKLYKNLGNESFRDVTAEVGLDKVFMPMGANFGDIDNDGFLDIYLGTGNPSYASLVPNVLLRNRGGKSFADVTTASGTGEWHKGHGTAFADLDNDGDEEIVAVIGGAMPGDSHALRLFENPGNDNNWVNLKLVGVKTNRAAIGARIKVTIENQGKATRSVYRTVGSGGSFGASPLQQHIGLGPSARIVDLDIWWPTSNTRQHFSAVDTNQFLEIKEFADNYIKLQRQKYSFGGTKRDATH